MTLDPDICYRAVESRDPRFDGRFFTGVLSTGIYCRPVCPARTPHRENVRFFSCAAAAEEAGLRPCLRCRPDASPGTPAWAGSSATVSRALRLINEGFLDGAGVDDLAATLGVSARHLRRLFDRHLGAAPDVVALTRRVHFARRLIDETALPITEIAFTAGFGSVRRFNDAFRRVFSYPPSHFRRATPRARDGAALRLRLAYRPPLDVDGAMSFLAARAVEPVESVEDGVYRRALTVGDSSGVVEVRGRSSRTRGHALELTVGADLAAHLPVVVARARRVFDLDADPLQVSSHLCRDPALAPWVRRRPGLRVIGAWDGFEMAVRAVVGQQVSVAGARTTLGRIVAAYGDDAGAGMKTFPQPQRLRRARLERCGVTRARAAAVRAVAASVCDGHVDLERPADPAAAAHALTRIAGVGPWTAAMVAMRGLGDPDAFPSGDLGVRRGAEVVAGINDERDLIARARSWRPWRAYAAVHLWCADAGEESR